MPRHPTHFLETIHLSKEVTSGDTTIEILKDVNLKLAAGESLAILGASGSGKTTLLTLLAGLDLPTAGDIYLDQAHINVMSEEQRAALRAKKVGFIFQSFQLLPTLTALQNVMLPLELHYVPYRTASEAAREWLTNVGLGGRLHHFPTTLSGGEQQRVAIARAFVSQPKIIFADEMTGNLDTKTGRVITNILFSLNQEKKITLVLVTHDEELAKRCQFRMLLQDGILNHAE